MNKLSRVLALLALLAFSHLQANAWDGTPTGTISGIEVTSGNNQAFRVYLTNVGAHCSGGATWAFLNETDSNYKTYIAVLLLAKSLNKPVTLYTVNVGIYCNIGHMYLYP